MPFTNCLGCDKQKRCKTDRFYSTDTIENPLSIINKLRVSGNAKIRKLNELDTVPAQSKICKSCYFLSKKLDNSDPNTPDLSIYRKGFNSHNRCIGY